MSLYENFHHHREETRQPVWLYFLVGALGVLLGGFLLVMLFLFMGGVPGLGWFASPQENEPEEGAVEERVVEEMPPPQEHQETEIVNAAEEVSPTVVGVSNYRRGIGPEGETLQEQGTGSGVIMDPQGIILTNHHVVEGADVVRVVFEDREVEEAEVLGKDTETDLAVLAVETNRELDYASFGETENLRPGETAVAIGNPLGLAFQQTVTSGVISGTERQVLIPGSEYRHTFVQTDAAINEGNSGGPLINVRGEVIGINTAKVLDPRVEGIGFAIPSETAEQVLQDIREHGEVIRPNIGITLIDYAEITGDISDGGVYIEEVWAEPAREAGLQEGDVIVAMEGQSIDYQAQLFDIRLHYSPGEEVDMTVLRDGEETTLTVTLGEPVDPQELFQ